MVVVFANQKGGVGKTTLAIAYANHLANNGRQVLLIDTDIQRSCTFRRASELENWDEDAVLYNVESHTLVSEEDSIKLMQNAHKISKANNATVIIDVPGNITEPYLAPIFIHSDFIVCPFVYQILALESTSTFLKVMLALKNACSDMHTKFVFIPNMVDKRFGTSEELDSFRKNADEVFEKIGVLTPRVYEKAELKRISTILYTPKQRKELENCFACLDANIL
ncbi:MAG: ParA family protein [Lachnospiraceae bacterium]|nr:ParA family protein [Lachnospiraceae bacterium]